MSNKIRISITTANTFNKLLLYNKVCEIYKYFINVDFDTPFFLKETEKFKGTFAQNTHIISGTTLVLMLISGFNVLSETIDRIGTIHYILDHDRVRLEKIFPVRKHFSKPVPHHYIWDG